MHPSAMTMQPKPIIPTKSRNSAVSTKMTRFLKSMTSPLRLRFTFKARTILALKAYR